MPCSLLQRVVQQFGKARARDCDALFAIFFAWRL